MNIAMITTVHPPLDGRIFYKECCSLRKHGHVVTLIAQRTTDVARQVREANVEFMPLDLTTRRIGRFANWFRVCKMLWKRRRAFQVWHFHDPELLLVLTAFHMVTRSNVALVYDLHEHTPSIILAREWISPRFRRAISSVFQRLEQLAMRRCHLVVAATETIAAYAEKSGAQTVCVKNYPLEPAVHSKQRQRKRADDNLVHLIYAGGLTETRGIREIIEAVGRLKNDTAHLTLLGEFSPEKFREEIMANLPNSVTVLDRVPFLDVEAFLDTADIGLVCLHPTPNHIEALPVKLFEYMRAGLPVIASNFPKWESIIREADCGIVINPCDVGAISDAISYLINNPHLRHALGENGRKACSDFYSWKSEESILVKAYARLQLDFTRG